MDMVYLAYLFAVAVGIVTAGVAASQNRGLHSCLSQVPWRRFVPW